MTAFPLYSLHCQEENFDFTLKCKHFLFLYFFTVTCLHARNSCKDLLQTEQSSNESVVQKCLIDRLFYVI